MRRTKLDLDGTIHLGKKVQKVRAIIGLKQAALADLAGFQQQYISRLERRSFISDDVLERLAIAMHVSVAFIKNFDEDVPFSRVNFDPTLSNTDKSVLFSIVFPFLLKVKEISENVQENVDGINRLCMELIALHQGITENSFLKSLSSYSEGKDSSS